MHPSPCKITLCDVSLFQSASAYTTLHSSSSCSIKFPTPSPSQSFFLPFMLPLPSLLFLFTPLPHAPRLPLSFFPSIPLHASSICLLYLSAAFIPLHTPSLFPSSSFCPLPLSSPFHPMHSLHPCALSSPLASPSLCPPHPSAPSISPIHPPS